MARRSGHVLRRNRMVRDTLWAPVPFVSTTITGGGATVLAQASAAEDALRPYTIVRTHIQLAISSDQLVATERQIGALGACVVSDQAAAIGVTAVPTPITDLESDAWYLHQPFIQGFDFVTGAGFDPKSFTIWDISSKAMRKVEDGFDNVLVTEVISGSAGTIIEVLGRQLLKLH